MVVIVKTKNNSDAVKAINLAKKFVTSKKNKEYVRELDQKVKTLIKKGYDIKQLKFQF